MNKINISLVIPSIEKTYDLFIPVNQKVSDVIYMLNKSINELTNGTFPIKNSITLFNDSTKQIINPEQTIKNANILNDTRIILL